MTSLDPYRAGLWPYGAEIEYRRERLAADFAATRGYPTMWSAIARHRKWPAGAASTGFARRRPASST